MKRILFVLMSFLLLNCSSDDNNSKSEEDKNPSHLLEFKNKELTLLVDEKVNLIYELTLKNIDVDDLQWFTSNPEVVTIEATTIMANKPGDSQVSVKDKKSGVSTSLLVKVDPPKEAKISFTKESLEIDGQVTRELDLKEFLVFENTSLDSIHWKSSDSSKAAVDNGVVFINGDGEIEIHAGVSDFSIKAKIVLKIKDVGVRQIELVGEHPGTFMKIGDQFQYSALVWPQELTEITKLEWSSSAPDVFTVDQTGLVTGVGEGDGYLTVEAPSGVFDRIGITVKGEAKLRDLRLEGDFYGTDLISGNTGFITVLSNIGEGGIDDLEYISDNPQVATVDNQGIIKSIKGKEGKVNITVFRTADPQNKLIATFDVVNRFYRFTISARLDGVQKDNKVSGLISLYATSESQIYDKISELKVYNKQGDLIKDGFEDVSFTLNNKTHTFSFLLDQVEEPYITYKLEQNEEVEYKKQKLIF
ncbi:Ig-like domain-containing protein [Myroides sp. LJL115]